MDTFYEGKIKNNEYKKSNFYFSFRRKFSRGIPSLPSWGLVVVKSTFESKLRWLRG